MHNQSSGGSANPFQHLPVPSFPPQQQTYIGSTNATFANVPWTHEQVRQQYDAAMRAAAPATDLDWLDAELQEVMAA